MKPDKHKKKASQAYKKKHNLNSTSADKSGKGKPNRTSSLSTVQQSQSFDNQKFKKRTIETNADRYEEKECEIYEPIGLDYNTLLNSAKNPASHLMLDIEKEWNSYPDFDEYLQFDCSKVADAFSELKFCDRFQVHENLVGKEMYDQLNETNLSSTNDKITKISDIKIIRDATLNIDNIDFNFNKKLQLDSNVDNCAEINTEKQNAEILTKLAPQQVSDEGKTPTSNAVSDVKKMETPDMIKISDVENKSGHEDGLDDLLDDLF